MWEAVWDGGTYLLREYKEKKEVEGDLKIV